MTIRVAVIGTGYLGTTHAVCMAALGWEVVGVDIDRERIAALRSGRLPFYEPGLAGLLRDQLAARRLSFTTRFEDAAEFADVHFICVGTPPRPDGPAADMSYLYAALAALAPALDRPCLVVGKSTVPVGTAERAAAFLAERAPVGERAELAWNPEFLREGFAIADTLNPTRLVFGVRTAAAEKVLRALYQPLLSKNVPLVVTDLATAELVKVAANGFLATKLSYINAMAEVCEAAGADVARLADALSYDPRIGGQLFKPGLGFGGGCLPKDIRAFVAQADDLGVGHAVAFLRDVAEINARCRARTVELARRLCRPSLRARRIAVWGAAFKPDSDDIRDSPALEVAETLRTQGAQVSIYDPKAMDNARKLFPALVYAVSPLDAAEGADLVLHLTEWSEFRELDPAAVAGVVRHKQIIDGRIRLDADAWRRAGWAYHILGRRWPGPDRSRLLPVQL